MITIEKYNSAAKKTWDEFVALSKNATFLFKRDYMDYHADRFTDHSLLFYEDGNLIALLPANIKDDIFYSHQGLTYGGFLTNAKMRTPLMLQLFAELLNYLKQNNVKKFIYKPIPQFYSALAAQEDLYALFRNNAVLFRRDVSSVINLKDKITFSELRRRMIKKALAQNLIVVESNNFAEFHKVLQQNLQAKHQTIPVHNISEIENLCAKFPQNIKLFCCFRENELLAASWVFINQNAVHLQYITSSDEGRKIGALDLVINHLINEKFSDKNYFDFGISTEENGNYLNEGLIAQKEMFGARAFCYDQYLIDLTT